MTFAFGISIFKPLNFMDMTSFSIQMKFRVNASPEEVFTLLADPEKIALWGGGKSVLEPKVGGQFEMFDGWVKGTVIDYVPGKALSYTWRPDDFHEEWADSEVHYKLRGVGEGTEISLEHVKLPNLKETKDHETGWEDYVFGPINEFLLHHERRVIS